MRKYKDVGYPPRLMFAEARLPKVRTYVSKHWAMRRVTLAEKASFDEPSVLYCQLHSITQADRKNKYLPDSSKAQTNSPGCTGVDPITADHTAKDYTTRGVATLKHPKCARLG